MRGRLPPMWALLALFLFLAGASTVAALPAESEFEFMTDLDLMPSCENAGLPVRANEQPADFPNSSEIEVFTTLFCILTGD